MHHKHFPIFLKVCTYTSNSSDTIMKEKLISISSITSFSLQSFLINRKLKNRRIIVIIIFCIRQCTPSYPSCHFVPFLPKIVATLTNLWSGRCRFVDRYECSKFQVSINLDYPRTRRPYWNWKLCYVVSALVLVWFFWKF